jgi:hypothetical protein
VDQVTRHLESPAEPVTELPAEPPIESVVEVGTEAAPIVETVATSPMVEPVETSPTKVDEVARAVLDRADHRDRDRGDRGKPKRDKKPEPTADTREFWETWAEEKSTRVAEPTPAEPVREAAPVADAAEAPRERRSRDRDRGRDRGPRDPRDTKPERSAKPDKAEHSDKPERASRTKRDTAVEPAKPSAPPAAATADGAQARLFISLGKKHGVSADDLRGLLSGPIGGDKARIGSVSLRDSHAHVRVPEEYVDAIIAGVHGTLHNEHDVTVERARA